MIREHDRLESRFGSVTVACLIGAIIVFTPGDTREFIYFRF